MDIPSLDHALALLGSLPARLNQQEAAEIYTTALEWARNTEGQTRTNYRDLAVKVLRAAGLRRKVTFRMVDPRQVPTELLELKWGPTWGLAQEWAHGCNQGVPGIEFKIEFEPFDG